MDITIAFEARVCGNEFGKTPACLVLTLTDDLRQKIRDAQAVARLHKFDEVKIGAWFYTPEECDDDLIEKFADAPCCVVDAADFADVDEQRVDCMGVTLVDADVLRLTCFDHYSDCLIQSSMVPVDTVLGLTATPVHATAPL